MRIKILIMSAIFFLFSYGTVFADKQTVINILPDNTKNIVSTINVYGGWVSAQIPSDGFNESRLYGSYDSKLKYDSKKEVLIRDRLQREDKKFPMHKPGRDLLEPSKIYQQAIKERLTSTGVVWRQRVVVLDDKTQTPKSEYYNCYYYERTDDGVFTLKIEYLPSPNIADSWFTLFINKIQTKEIF